MLDGCGDAGLELNGNTPLSSQRIKELTMKQVKKTHKVRRFGTRLLIAAAIISMLTVTAFAAEAIFNVGEIIRDLFRQDIPENQVEVLNQLGGSFQPQTITREGTTMTLAAAYGDDHVLYAYLQVTAPEGTVLPDDISYIFYDPNAVNYEAKYGDEDYWKHIQIPEGNPYKLIYGMNVEVQPLADENPLDNYKEFYLIVTAQDGQDAKFNDGVAKVLNIMGVYEQVPNVNMDEDGYYLLAPGTFSFDVGIVNEAKKVELDVAGLTYGGDTSRTWTCGFEECGTFCEGLETNGREHTEYWNYSVGVKKLVISPLSAEWEIDYSTDKWNLSLGLQFAVVMKDGSRVEMTATAMSDGGTYSRGIYRFETPVDLDQVDYILIGDEKIDSTHMVYLPTNE
jgi:hypothetical protein